MQSWTRKPHPAIYVMRYEDMVAEPTGTFGGLVRHLLLECDAAASSRKRVDRSSFARLRAQEGARGFRERPPNADR